MGTFYTQKAFQSTIHEWSRGRGCLTTESGLQPAGHELFGCCSLEFPLMPCTQKRAEVLFSQANSVVPLINEACRAQLLSKNQGNRPKTDKESNQKVSKKERIQKLNCFLMSGVDVWRCFEYSKRVPLGSDFELSCENVTNAGRVAVRLTISWNFRQ